MRGMAGLFASLAVAFCATALHARERVEPVTVGIIAFNDFHGNLEPLPAAASGPASGGIVALATAVEALREIYRYHATVSAGDLIGASPLVSALFLDEPTITMMNLLDLDYNAVGNHEFDRGRAELLRMQRGGCDWHTAREPCQVGSFSGAGFAFLAASTFTEDATTLFPASAIKSFGKGRRKVRIGFVGLTLRDTPNLVSGEGVAGLRFGDEAEAINAATAQLKAKGADAVVVLIHQGGDPLSDLDPNGCDGLGGAILPILGKLDRRVDVVVSGHTHRAYVCDPGEAGEAYPFLLTSAGSHGRFLTDIALTIDPATDRVIARTARNLVVQAPVAAAGVSGPASEEQPVIAHFLQEYVTAASELALRPVGRLSAPAARPQGPNRSQGGPLGNLIADAQLGATLGAGAQIAFTNPFGIRAPLDPAPGGAVTFGQLSGVQPFLNTLVTYTLSGAGLKDVLEQGLDTDGPEQLLAPSAGFAYGFDRSRAPGDRILRMTLMGEPIEPWRDYRITTNSFLAGGKDGFTALLKGRDAVIGGSDLDALESWIGAVDIRQLPMEERVTPEGS